MADTFGIAQAWLESFLLAIQLSFSRSILSCNIQCLTIISNTTAGVTGLIEIALNLATLTLVSLLCHLYAW